MPSILDAYKKVHKKLIKENLGLNNPEREAARNLINTLSIPSDIDPELLEKAIDDILSAIKPILSAAVGEHHIKKLDQH
jgi:hypothetical protein